MMSVGFTEWFQSNPAADRLSHFQQWSKDNPTVVAIGLLVLGGLLTSVVWPAMSKFAARCWTLIVSYVLRNATQKAYLDSVIDKHRFLPILPSTLVPVTSLAQTPELDDLYVSLTVNASGGPENETSLTDLLGSNTRLMILGDPGSGKTTMLRYLALTFARARRGSIRTQDRLANDSNKAKVKIARSRVDEFRLSHRPVPILIYLNRLKDVANWSTTQPLFDHIEEEWKRTSSHQDDATEAFRKVLDKGNCIFLFDAFDELATESARTSVANLIGQFCAQVHARNRFVITSRRVGYHGQLNTSGFRVVTIQKLSSLLISKLVTQWYKVLGKPELAEQLLATFKVNVRLLDLAENPMLLSLTVLVQYVVPLIPDKRHVLFEECLKILIERRYAPPEIQAAYNEILPADEAMAIVREIAAELHKSRAREITRPRLCQIVIPAILDQMPFTKAAQLAPEAIIRNIEERSQLLVERGIDESGRALMAFSHLTFQEYLTSVSFLSSMGSRGRQDVIDEVLILFNQDPGWWEEVAVLFAAQLDGRVHKQFLDSLKSATKEK